MTLHSHTFTQSRPLRRRSLVDALRSIHATWRQRRALAALDAAALKDIGLTERDVHREIRRPIWDLPAQR